jgi:DNA helicase HerA-like ATPase
LVLEEAHNYLKPRRDDEVPGTTAAREAFERIAKEGRKFGLSLIIASQRPSDVSATVLSQCANFLVHRIQNPEDLDYFKKILPTGSRDLLDQLPILAPGDAILLGSATNVPARVTIRLPHPEPQSETPKPWKAWQSSSPTFDITASAAQWIQETEIAEPEPSEDDSAEPEPPEDYPF